MKIPLWSEPATHGRCIALTCLARCGRAWPLVLPVLLAGCGTGLSDYVHQTVSATGRTVFDLWLTELANDVADALAPPDEPNVPDPNDGTPDPNDPNDGVDPNDPNNVPPAGDPQNGAAVYAANSCATCHCDDASGGCGLDAPDLAGVSVGQLDDRLRGAVPHPGGKFELTDQELQDLAAFLSEPAGVPGAD